MSSRTIIEMTHVLTNEKMLRIFELKKEKETRIVISSNYREDEVLHARQTNFIGMR